MKIDRSTEAVFQLVALPHDVARHAQQVRDVQQSLALARAQADAMRTKAEAEKAEAEAAKIEVVGTDSWRARKGKLLDKYAIPAAGGLILAAAGAAVALLQNCH